MTSELSTLPTERTSFVGRRGEIARAIVVLGASRIVTLTGAGGVGKSRLAVRVASQVRRSFPAGVLRIDLAGARGDCDVLDGISQAIGPVEGKVAEDVKPLAECIGQRRLLLVLDNCESATAGVAALVDTVTELCDEVRVLATSRQPLGVYGEVVRTVPPMGTRGKSSADRDTAGWSEAANLFLERAAALGGSVEDPVSRSIVEEICRGLQGVPLAIELAAARVRALSLVQIRDRLIAANGTAQPHRVMRASIARSLQLCSAVERLAWAKLSIFRGGFALDAAEQICCGPDLAAEEVLEVIQSLVDKSVLSCSERSYGVRFEMLESVRSIGVETLESMDLLGPVQLLHSEWCAQLLAGAQARFIGAEQPSWIERLRDEAANIDLACTSALERGDEAAALTLSSRRWALTWLLDREGTASRALRTVVQATTNPTAQRAAALCQLAVGDALSGRAPDPASRSLAAGRAAVAHAGSGDASGVILAEAQDWAAIADAVIALARRDPSSAIQADDADQPRSPADLQLRCAAQLLQVVGSRVAGDRGRAIAGAEQLLVLSQDVGEVLYGAYALAVLAYDAVDNARLEQAAVLARRSLNAVERTADRVGLAVVVHVFAALNEASGQLRYAAGLLGALDPLRTEIGTDHILFGSLCPPGGLTARVRARMSDEEFSTAFATGKQMPTAEIIDALLGRRSLAVCTPPSDEDRSLRLTRREREVALLVSEGLTDKQIAARLVIARRTAEGHVSSILAKTGCASRSAVTHLIVEQQQAQTARSPDVPALRAAAS